MGGFAIIGFPTDRTTERGGSKLNTLLTLLILGSLVFAGVKIIPAYFANYQFQDAIETEARFSIANRKGEDDVREDVWKKIQELGIPAKKEDIRILSNEGYVQISLSYTVPVDLRVYQFKLEFHPHADNRTL